METSLHSTLITDQNRLIVTTERGLEDMIVRVLSRLGINMAQRPDNSELIAGYVADEVSTAGAKKILKEKGYKVTSHPGLNAVLTTYEITGVKRGKENWYKVSDLDRVPSKK